MPIYVLWRNDLCLFTVTLDPVGKSTVTNKVVEANTPILPAGDHSSLGAQGNR